MCHFHCAQANDLFMFIIFHMVLWDWSNCCLSNIIFYQKSTSNQSTHVAIHSRGLINLGSYTAVSSSCCFIFSLNFRIVYTSSLDLVHCHFGLRPVLALVLVFFSLTFIICVKSIGKMECNLISNLLNEDQHQQPIHKK